MNSKTAITVVIVDLVLIGVIGFFVLSPAEPPQNQTPPNQNTTSSMVRVAAPQPGARVTSPVRIAGEARGIWFFEASFPVKILDGDGTLLGIEPAQTQGEWMTEDFVPFEVMIAFSKPKFATGTLVLQKDNPSGLPEHDAEVRIPISFGVFGSSRTGSSTAQCFIGGCSGQVCSDKEGVVTTCEFRPEYACYKTARCERQSNGRCGWTQTTELLACIRNAQQNSSAPVY